MKAKSVFKSAEGKKAILAVYDSLLEQWPVAFDKLILKTRHGDTFVIACGEKSLPPLILIHGSSSNSAMWIGEISSYCKHYRVYAVDIPGEPGKSQDNRLDLNLPVYAEWLDDVFKELKIQKAAIVGMSLGGWMALKFSILFPDKVSKLALLCPAGIGPQRASFMFYAMLMMFLGNWGFENTIRKVYGRNDIPAEALEYSRLIAKNFNPFVGVIPLFSDSDLKSLTMPIMLIIGEKDALLDSRKTVERLSKLLPQTQISLLPGAGHALINLCDRVIPFLSA